MRASLILAMTSTVAALGCERQVHLVAVQATDAAADAGGDPWWQSLTADRIATGLSHFLWQLPPDKALVEKVRQRPPATPAEIGALAREMLLDLRGLNVAKEFLRYWWRLRDLTTANKDPTAFPNYEALLREEVQQALMISLRMVEPELSLLDLLGENRVVVNNVVAPLYGMSEASGDFVWRELGPATDATAILPLPAVMALLAGRIESHISRRGAAYLTQLFCIHRPAPHGAMPPPPPMPPTTTMRQRLHAATRAPGCSECHDAVDNLGQAFERFDAVGAYHETVRGETIVVRGFLDLAGDRFTFNDVRDLVSKVSRPDVATLIERCYAAHWLAFATGRALTTADPAEPDAIQIQAAASTNGRLRLRATIAAVTETRSFWGVR